MFLGNKFYYRQRSARRQRAARAAQARKDAAFKAQHGFTKVSPTVRTSVCKVDDSLGIVFGWAVISSIDGTPYVDTQGDHIPEDAMLKAAADFMESRRALKAMHSGGSIGSVIFAWPMTAEIAKAFGADIGTTGLMIGVKPTDTDVLAKFRSGEYTGFSIGGVRIEEEEVES